MTEESLDKLFEMTLSFKIGRRYFRYMIDKKEYNLTINVADGYIIYSWLIRLEKIFSTTLTNVGITLSIIITLLSILQDSINQNMIDTYITTTSLLFLFVFSIMPKFLYNEKCCIEKHFIEHLLNEKDFGRGILVAIDSNQFISLLHNKDTITNTITKDDHYLKIKIALTPYVYLISKYTLKIIIIKDHIITKFKK